MEQKKVPYSEGTLQPGESVRKTTLLKPLENEKLYKSLMLAGIPVKTVGSKFVAQYRSEVVYLGDESDEELIELSMSINHIANVAQVK